MRAYSYEIIKELLPKQTKEENKLPLNKENVFGFIFTMNNFPNIGSPSWTLAAMAPTKFWKRLMIILKN